MKFHLPYIRSYYAIKVFSEPGNMYILNELHMNFPKMFFDNINKGINHSKSKFHINHIVDLLSNFA